MSLAKLGAPRLCRDRLSLESGLLVESNEVVSPATRDPVLHLGGGWAITQDNSQVDRVNSMYISCFVLYSSIRVLDREDIPSLKVLARAPATINKISFLLIHFLGGISS